MDGDNSVAWGHMACAGVCVLHNIMFSMILKDAVFEISRSRLECRKL